MIAIVLSLIILLSLAADAYLWHRVVRRRGLFWRILHWALPACGWTAVIVLGLCGLTLRAFTLGFLLVLMLHIPEWVHALLALLRLPRLGCLARVALMLLTMVGFLFGWKMLGVRDVNVSVDTLPPSFQGYRIAHISDMHIGTYASAPDMVDRIVIQINVLHPDLIVFTGDLVNLSSDELKPFLPVLSRLRASDGIVSVLGNHDYCTYGPKDDAHPAQAQMQELIDMQRSMGWHLLMNEHLTIHRDADSIAIVGIENDGRPPFPQRADLGRSMRGIHPGTCTILLSHDPSFWRRSVVGRTDIPLTLSGHTHAMQLRIGRWSPSALIYPEWGGLYTEGSQQLYVNTGTGSSIPFRLGAWPEITVITLTGADAR